MTAGGDPDGGNALAEAFEAQRPRLVRVAYATVGSVAEAEDCVQEAWLRLLVTAFAAACAEGDLERLVTMLDPDVVWRGDGGGKVASRPGARGAEQVAAALLALTRRPPRQIVMATVNGAPGLVLRDADDVLSVVSFTVDGGRITAIDVVRNPDKLTGVREPG